MTTTTELLPSRAHSAGERLRTLAEAGFARFVALWRAARNRRSVNRLLDWDARMLSDIGLTPGDVQSALAAPLGDDPSYRLGALSAERRSAFRADAEEKLARRSAGRVRSKSERLAGVNRVARPHRALEI